MKLYELIAQLETLEDKYGDYDVVMVRGSSSYEIEDVDTVDVIEYTKRIALY